ncbi:TonB-dependent receptor [Robertkochia sediminum]|uniref:TonB-dependent receptor n=1 Tax=Robertkochia sediminum TaxID=2785326 RepID=UPI001933A47A|nr:TonB-dependent receptor [Robertkochia sediminum]MBL7473704.1 TonB-dependent receptor [Robertkochia sediminum]
MQNKCRLVCISILLLSMLSVARAQTMHTISGEINELSTKESVIGASIFAVGTRLGTATNEYGFYSLTLPEGRYELVVSALGYKTITRKIDLKENLRLDFLLEEDAQLLEEVVVTENSERIDIKRPQMSVNSLRSTTIKNIPVVLGEPDVLRSLVLLPGVSNGGEGASGFNVRGGAADQNLILLDEAIIFNSSHLFGFFSVFNPDAIKDLKLFKGGIPARYGGRVSSVLDIYQKEGNKNDIKVTGGIGAVASRLLVEGPINKERSSFLFGGRSSYAQLFLPLLDIDNSASFYDLNTKFSFKLNQNNNIYFSGYFGRDKFRISESFVNYYGNAVFNFRWNHIFSEKLFSNLSMIYSDYDYGLELDFVGFEWDSGIQNLNFKYDLKYYLNNDIQVNFGTNNIYYTFNPGRISPNREDSGITEDQLTRKYANEFALYADIEQRITEQLSVQYGIRFSHFTRLGQDDLAIYENDHAVKFNPELGIYEEAEPIEIINPGRGKSLATFANLEPRVSLTYYWNDQNAIKASYMRVTQYLHLLSNTSSPTPLDVWTPSGPFIEPQIADQIAAGYFREFSEKGYSLEAEVFYKKIQNRIDYIDGADLIAKEYIECIILNGEARAYGAELLLRKNTGNLQGWLAYTLSRSEQRTPGRGPVEFDGQSVDEPGINNGAWYNTPWDKTHDISLYTSYKLNSKWKFNANFIYQTGQPTNYPTGQFEFEGISVPYYGLRNEARLPDYHRLDLAVTLTPEKNRNRKWQGEWVFSVYNAYNRRNAASINFRRNSDSGVNEAVRTAIFGIVPSVTYNFNF